MSLLTLVHISDLHIGRLDEFSVNARTQAWKKWKWFTGLLGHSEDSITDLEKFWKSIRETPDTHLIMTGDATSMGHPLEFDIFNKYLVGILPSPDGDLIGLGDQKWSDRAISGNHDQWSGRPHPLGGPTAALRHYFPRFPLTGPTFNLLGGLQLRVLRIDTDADIAPLSWNRLYALGSFVTQLASLQGMLDKLTRNENEIRALCLHHSASYSGRTLEIVPQSLAALKAFILRNRVSVLLCGHIHRPPKVGPFNIGMSSSAPQIVLEALCGTTTQFDPTIGRNEELDGKVDTSWENSLIVHRLDREGSEILWTAELFLQGRAGFVRADQLRHDINPVTRMKAWPWPPVMRT